MKLGMSIHGLFSASDIPVDFVKNFEMFGITEKLVCLVAASFLVGIRVTVGIGRATHRPHPRRYGSGGL